MRLSRYQSSAILIYSVDYLSIDFFRVIRNIVFYPIYSETRHIEKHFGEIILKDAPRQI